MDKRIIILQTNWDELPLRDKDIFNLYMTSFEKHTDWNQINPLPEDHYRHLKPHYLKRKISNNIKDFIERRRNGALLISGERGIGKTTIVKEIISRLQLNES